MIKILFAQLVTEQLLSELIAKLRNAVCHKISICFISFLLTNAKRYFLKTKLTNEPDYKNHPGYRKTRLQRTNLVGPDLCISTKFDCIYKFAIFNELVTKHFTRRTLGQIPLLRRILFFTFKFDFFRPLSITGFLNLFLHCGTLY